jgi:heavy metal sensor kinase
LPFRIITYPLIINGKTEQIIQVGSSLRAPRWLMDRMLIVLGISVPLSLLLFSYGGWFLAGLALKPVDLITRSVKKITAANLSHRLEVVNSHDEISHLVETFNAPLARLENSFNKTRQFSADVSHELRTPLTILRGETEVALRWAKEPDEYRGILQSNLEEIKRMSQIIEYLLDLAKAEERRLELNLQEVDLNGLLATLVQQTAMIAHEKGVRLVFEAPVTVPFKGDELRLRQIFLNLLDNAVKYTAEGGEVKVQISVEGGWARVAVKDTGAGIPEEDLPHIFDRFYRVDKARNRAQGGTGLGLSLSRSLVEAHGGHIEVESEVEVGSTFTVHLPIS